MKYQQSGFAVEFADKRKEISIDQVIEEVLENFDFIKVHKVMEALDWKWVGGDTQDGVPSVYRLIKKAEELLKDCVNEIEHRNTNTLVLSTGGFKATCVKYDDGEIVLELEFVLSDFNYSNFGTCY
jgi:hypothetical protein